MTTQEEFFQQHAVDGQLTDAQMAEMLLLPAEGESGPSVAPVTEEGGEAGKPDPASAPPAPTPAPAAEGDSKEVKDGATDSPQEPASEPDEATLNRDNAVILAKDGKHTISYDKLEEARERARAEAEARAAAEAEAKRLRDEIEALRAQTTSTAPAQAQAAAPADPGTKLAVDPAKLLEGVDFGDFSDEAVAKATAAMQAKAAQMLVAPLQAELEALRAKATQAAAPTPAAPAADPAQEHYRAIYAAHPDADSIAESQEFAAWLDGQPKVAAAAYRAALQGGTAEEVIETFTAFKDATGKTGAAPAPGPAAAPAAEPGKDVVAAAEAAVANAKARPPTSLSEIPAGSEAHHNEADAWLAKSSTQALASFEGMTPEQIERVLQRTL